MNFFTIVIRSETLVLALGILLGWELLEPSSLEQLILDSATAALCANDQESEDGFDGDHI